MKKNNNTQKKKNKASTILIIVLLIIAALYITFRYEVAQCRDTIHEDDYDIYTVYKIYYRFGNVIKVTIQKEVKSNNSTILEYFQNNFTDVFEDYNRDYGGYTIDSKKSKNKMVFRVEWNTKKADLSKLVEKHPYLKENIEKNRLNVSGVYRLFNLDKTSC